MQPTDRGIAVIVVLGSVKAKDYQRFRLKHFLQGRKVRIVRLADDLRDRIEGEFDDTLSYEENMNMSAEEHQEGRVEFFKAQFPGEVIEVIAYEDWWNSHDPYEHFFSHHQEDYWPSLQRVTLILGDGTYDFV